jgi:hypothetical protein
MCDCSADRDGWEIERRLYVQSACERASDNDYKVTQIMAAEICPSSIVAPDSR